MSKTDYELGKKVSKHLILLGIETPMTNCVHSSVSNETKIKYISTNIKNCLEVLNLDLSDDSLKDTPDRVAKMWVNEIFSGLDYRNFPKITVIDNKMNYDEMIVEANITANSTCEHHIIQIDQKVDIAYIPTQKVVGLSKLARIAKFFAQRPEVQERYCSQVFETIKFILDTPHVAVSVKGKHYCMISRGVEDSGSYTITNKLGGAFKDDHHTRQEFFKCIKD